MGRRALSSLLLAALGGSLVSIAAPLQTRPPTGSSGTGLIIGKVLDSEGAPVAAATVRLSGPAGWFTRVDGSSFFLDIVTDEEGEFYFTALPRGQYYIRTQRTGYADGQFGRRLIEGPGGFLNLAEAERRTDVSITMWKFASVSGVVTDEAGAPMEGVQVTPYRRSLVSGQWIFQPVAGSHPSDDQGAYRLYGLMPGEYVMAASASSTILTLASPQDGGGVARRFSYPAGSYPAPGVAGVGSLSILAGQDITGADFHLSPVPAFRVAGTVQGGPERSTGSVSLVPESAISSRNTPFAPTMGIRPDGSFSIDAVPAGRYVLRAYRRAMPARPLPESARTIIQTPGRVITLPDPSGSPSQVAPTPIEAAWYAAVPVEVGTYDLDNVSVLLRPGPVVDGQLVFDGATTMPSANELRNGVIVQLEPADEADSWFTSSPVRMIANRGFTISELRPARYVVRVQPDEPWTLRRATLDNLDVTAAPFDLGSGERRTLVVTFTDRQTSIEGLVASDSSVLPEDVVVAFFPTDSRLWVEYGRYSTRQRWVVAAQNGHYQSALLPGDYCVVALTGNLGSDWQDPANLRFLSSLAQRVTLREGDHLALNLRAQTIR